MPSFTQISASGTCGSCGLDRRRVEIQRSCQETYIKKKQCRGRSAAYFRLGAGLERVSVPAFGDEYMNSIMKWRAEEEEDDVDVDGDSRTNVNDGLHDDGCLCDRVEYRARGRISEQRLRHDDEPTHDDDEPTPHDDCGYLRGLHVNGAGPHDGRLLGGSNRNVEEDGAGPLVPDESSSRRSSSASDGGGGARQQRQHQQQSEASGGQQDDIRPEQVRWFYRLENDKKWTPFIGYDSLRIELKFRQLRGADLEPFESGLFRELHDHEIESLCSEERILVRGGLYEIDVERRLCTSIFWKGEDSCITRGVWFYDGSKEPLEEQDTEEIEHQHLTRFRDYQAEPVQPDSPKKTATQVLHHVQLPDFHIDWYGPTEVYYYSEAKSSKLMRSFSEKLGFQKSGYKLQRGFVSKATVSDKQPDITHLVFVVHGVGQKIDVQKIIRNCGSLRMGANVLKDKYFTHLNELNERSEFFPVEWRSSLRLDGDTVDLITPHRVRGLREFLNCSAMDVMYYTSPLYRLELIRGLQKELNRLYRLFCLHNPHFESKGGLVSIVAHSLGCVIAYDIITGWNPMHQTDSMLTYNNHAEVLERVSPATGSQARDDLVQRLEAAKLEIQYLEEQLRVLNESEAEAKGPKNNLQFCVENFFCLGSPLAVFLALRGIRPSGTGLMDDILPRTLVKRFFNIYHPADPVAYRLEPLVLKHYSKVLPLHIHHHATADKKPYEEMKPELIPLDPQDKRPHSPSSEDCQILATTMTAKSSPNKVGTESRWSLFPFIRRKDNTDVELKTPASHTNSCPSSPPPLPTNAMLVDAGTLDLTEIVVDGLSSPKTESETSRPPTPDHATISTSTGLRADSPITPEPSELEYRLDYVLREGRVESSWLSALFSHTNYWSSHDVTFLILSYLHKTPASIAATPPTASPAHSSKSPAHSSKSPVNPPSPH